MNRNKKIKVDLGLFFKSVVFSWVSFFILMFIFVFANVYLSPKGFDKVEVKHLTNTFKDIFQPLPEELKLKTDKEKVLGSTLDDDIVSYSYDSGVTAPPKEGEDISMRTPNSFTRLRGVADGKRMYETTIYSAGGQFVDVGVEKWNQVEYATTTRIAFERQMYGNFARLFKQKAIAHIAFFAGAGDGHVQAINDSNWNTTHDDSFGSTKDNTSTTMILRNDRNALNLKYILYRVALPFNTSSIPSNATVLDGKVVVYVESENETNNASPSVGLIQTTTLSHTSLIVADISRFGSTDDPTEYAARVDLDTTGAFTFVLNTAGLGIVKRSGDSSSCGSSLTGWTCLGLRGHADITDDPPFRYNHVNIYTSESASTIFDPYISLGWSVPDADVSGTVYTDKGVTAAGADVAVKLVTDGGTAYSTTTASDGSYIFNNVSLSFATDAVIYLNTDGGVRGAVLVESPENAAPGDMTNLDIWQDRIRVIDSEFNANLMTSGSFDFFDQDDDPDIPFQVNSNVLTASTSIEFVIDDYTTNTFSLDGNMAVDDLDIDTIFAPGTNTVTVSGSLDEDGSITLDDTNWVFDSTSAETLSSGGSVLGDTSGSVTFNGIGGSWVLADAFDTNGTLTITNGTLDANGKNIDVTGTFSNNDTLLLEGGETTVIFTSGFDTNSGTTTYDGGSSYTGLSAGDSYYNLQFNNAGGSWTLDSDLDVNGNLLITAGTLNTGGYNVNVAGDLIVRSSATFIKGIENSDNLTFDGTGAQTLIDSSAKQNFGDIVVNGTTNTLTLGTSATSTSIMVYSGNTLSLGSSGYILNLANQSTTTPLNISGTLNEGNNSTVRYVSGTASTVKGETYNRISFASSTVFTLGGQINASSTLTIENLATLNGGGNTIILDEVWTNNGIFTHGGGKVIFSTTTPATQTLTSGGQVFNSIEFNDSGGDVTYSLSDQLNASGTISILGGTLDSNGQNIYAGGNWINSDIFTHGGGLVTFSSTTDTTSITSGGYPFSALTFNDSSGSATFSLVDQLNASGTLTIIGGTLDSNANNIILDGNWINADIFTAGTATTTFASSSSQSITSGSSNFYNLFHTGSGTTTISDTTTIGGNLRISLGGLLINALTTVTGDIINEGVIEEATSYISKDAESLSLDKASYNADSDTSLTITLIDHDENLSGFATNTASTTVSLTTGTDSETVTLTETGLATRIFTGTLAIAGDASVVLEDGTLQINESTDTINVSYTDNEDSSDNSASDTATISATIVVTVVAAPSSGGGGGGVVFFPILDTKKTLLTDILDPTIDVVVNVKDKIIDIIKPIIPPFLIPDRKPDEVVILPSCNVYNCGWNYINTTTLQEFVLAPLPEDLKILARKFPELDTTLGQIGIDRLGRLEQLVGVKLSLPGIKTAQDLNRLLDTNLSFTKGNKLAEIEEIVGDEFILGKVNSISDLESLIGSKINIENISTLEDIEIALGIDLGDITVNKLKRVQEFSGVTFNIPKILTLRNLGITTFEEINELADVRLAIPLLRELKDIPSEIVFARAGNKLIDFNLSLDISRQGDISQRITAVSGQQLNLAVRPEYDVESVTGYLVLKESVFSEANEIIPGSILTSSLIFSTPNIGNKIASAPLIEDRLLIEKFIYTDSDGDGIYTADIQAPLISGVFEIITIMDYTNPNNGLKELRLILVVDPEGYIFESVNGSELRISKAQVSIFWKNNNNEFILWPANEFQQKNPQTTKNNGEYSFLVPEGEYYLTVEADLYNPYQSEVFDVLEGRGIHLNIEMKKKGFDVRSIKITWVALAVLAMLSVYNFYRGRRSKFKKI